MSDLEDDDEGVPVSMVGVLDRAFAGTASPRAAIKAKCLECVGYIRADVTRCTASPGKPGACPLWLYRPYSGNGRSR